MVGRRERWWGVALKNIGIIGVVGDTTLALTTTPRMASRHGRWAGPGRACRAGPSRSTPDGARATIAARIDHYNNRRLHSAIGYITSRDQLLDRETEIWAERDRRLEAARARRSKRRELDLLGRKI